MPRDLAVRVLLQILDLIFCFFLQAGVVPEEILG
jgi:hypothetical protein